MSKFLSVLLLLATGCATPQTGDIYVVRALSDRISKVEDALKVEDTRSEEKRIIRETEPKYLTETQKEFIMFMNTG